MILSETGSGKTFAYLLPILQNIKEAGLIHSKNFQFKDAEKALPKALIFVPNQELVWQLEEILNRIAKEFTVLSLHPGATQNFSDLCADVSILSYLQKKSEKNNCAIEDEFRYSSKPPQILICTPGAFSNFLNDDIDKIISNLEYIVVDEADILMSEVSGKWFLKFISDLMKFPKERTFVFCGATMASNSKKSPRLFIQNLLKKKMEVAESQSMHCSADVEGIDVSFVLEDQLGLFPDELGMLDKLRESKRLEEERKKRVFEAKMSKLKEILSTEQFKSCLVFVENSETMTKVFEMLKVDNVQISSLNKQIDSAKRQSLIKRLTSKSADDAVKDVVIATNLMSRGIDIPSLDLVIQFDFATSVVDYVHRVGRTSRMGRIGKGILYLNSKRIISCARKTCFFHLALKN